MSRATALESGGGSGSALLLRLFESSFFDVHLAIGYLKTYPNSIGITHYLINRLRSFEYEDVEFYWPQLCYLAITRPSPSTALENFILERCQEDAHIAVITLWYLQASLSDLAAMPKSDQFAACRRILNRVQEIIFSDPPLPSSAASSSSPSKTPSPPASNDKPTQDAEEKQDSINAPTASFVGIGLLLAAIGMPQLVNVAGRMVVEQGRRTEPPTRDEVDDADEDGAREGGNSESGSEGEAGVAKAVVAKKAKTGIAGALLNGSAKGSKKATVSSASKPTKRSQTQPNYLPGDRITASPRIPLPSAHESRSMSFLPSPSAKSPTKQGPTSSGASSTSPLSPLERRGSLKHSVLRQSTAPSLSVPSLPMTSKSASNLLNSPSSTSQHLSGTSMPGYGLPKTFLSRLLLLQACRSQLDLIRSLQDISTRLVLVPKPARLSSLRAELTVLNHGLPRGCSLGMSTRPPPVAVLPDSTPKPPASSPQPSSPFDKPHPPTPRRKQARVVRISPGESVVLNSADRAPFVIYVEVLEEDLDFDPDRRSNWEDLRRALREREGLATASIGAKGKALAENGRLSLESGMDGYAKQADGSSTPSKGQDAPVIPHQPTSPSPGTPFAERAEYALGGGLDGGAPTEGDIAAEPAGEMDLVEQLYGDISLRDDPLAEPPTEEVEEEIHNRDVDEAAWRRKDEAAKAKRRDRTASTASSTTSRSRTSISSATGEPLSVGPKAARRMSGGTARPGGRSIASRAPISLEDYAERMRMAAIMLAQLDASQTASRGVVGAGTAAAGTLVTLPVYTVAGIGGVVGAGLGAGLGAVKARLSKKETPAASAGQGGAGTRASLDTASAAEGTSAVAGQPPLNPVAAALSHGAAEASSSSGSAPSKSTATTGTSGSSTPAPLPTQRPRVLAPQDAAAIRDRIMSEMMALEEERMERMRGDVESRSGWTAAAGSAKTQDNTVVMRAVNKDDPSGAVFAESFTSKTARIRSASPFGHLPSWSLLSCIVKTGADLRQEQLAVQLISEFGRIWKEEDCPGWVYYFRMIVTSENSGLIETINDAVSVHSLKKNAYARRAEDGTQAFDSYSLYDHFVNTYGSPDSSKYRKAQDAFIQSLAAYSVICYLLQLKDRHNGNILLDRQGHLIHIDFGFMLSNSPGSIGFEMAPFKLPQDYIDILGGFDSPKFAEFRALFKRCFRDARKHAERIITLVELMQKDSSLPCFSNGELTSQQLRERFMLSLPQAQLDEYADKLILNSAQSSFTRLYDLFQGYSNGILI
ncbi:RHTO0S09e06370g1_1 [Rhodotorula toruloides]|uniref:1-phosphatidylinositol 4-kinase n=1 Tax=Rhodotorula toruloides TaxID=5286 RepID=A0A061B9L1_RHOTO|nr:RHTO0S09e06370g1_1 [Rhodotorula toruloides]